MTLSTRLGQAMAKAKKVDASGDTYEISTDKGSTWTSVSIAIHQIDRRDQERSFDDTSDQVEVEGVLLMGKSEPTLAIGNRLRVNGSEEHKITEGPTGVGWRRYRTLRIESGRAGPDRGRISQ